MPGRTWVGGAWEVQFRYLRGGGTRVGLNLYGTRGLMVSRRWEYRVGLSCLGKGVFSFIFLIG